MELAFRGRRYPIPSGELMIGADSAAGLVLEGARPRHASVRSLGDKMATIRALEPGAEIFVNGVRVGDEPTPLLHGDTIRIANQEVAVVNPGHSVGTPQTPPPGARERLHDTLFGMPRTVATPPPPAPGMLPTPARGKTGWIVVAAVISLALLTYLLLR